MCDPARNAVRPTEDGRRVIVTSMKDEGPFILEWLAHHRAIGVDDFLIYSNDCFDGTDDFLSALDRHGIVRHRVNPFRAMDVVPQQGALRAAAEESVVQRAAWLACIDVDEFINIKIGDGTLSALFAAIPDANMIAMTWRLFGNGNINTYEDDFVTEQFQLCAPELTRKPHQAWGFKTLYRNLGLYRKLGVHRPKGLNAHAAVKINWVNGSGQMMPPSVHRQGWRSTTETYGYDLVQLNHYAVRSAESFLVKRDRGRVNHVSRDQGLAYWFRMNNNAEPEASIQARLPAARAEYERLRSDPEIDRLHRACVAAHSARIVQLRKQGASAELYRMLTSARMQHLSRLHAHLGANVFLSGPQVVPEEIAARAPGGSWFFNVAPPMDAAH